MSFNGSNSFGEIVATRECRPDYEKQAAAQLKTLNNTEEFIKACKKFMDNNSIHQFQNISSFAELFGGLHIIKIEQEKAYERTLKNLEEGNNNV